jgi:hypothetical protein
MKTKFYTKTFLGMLVACLFCVSAVPAEAASMQKKSITTGVSLMKKTFNGIGNAIWNNKGAIAVGTAAVAVATQPDILAQPITAATTAVTTETSKTVLAPTIETIGMILLFTALFVIVPGLICVGRHYLKLWHIVPLLLVGVLICSSGIAEAGTLPVAAIQSVAVVNPIVNIVSWVVIIVITIFIG